MCEINKIRDLSILHALHFTIQTSASEIFYVIHSTRQESKKLVALQSVDTYYNKRHAGGTLEAIKDA